MLPSTLDLGFSFTPGDLAYDDGGPYYILTFLGLDTCVLPHDPGLLTDILDHLEKYTSSCYTLSISTHPPPPTWVSSTFGFLRDGVWCYTEVLFDLSDPGLYRMFMDFCSPYHHPLFNRRYFTTFYCDGGTFRGPSVMRADALPFVSHFPDLREIQGVLDFTEHPMVFLLPSLTTRSGALYIRPDQLASALLLQGFFDYHISVDSSYDGTFIDLSSVPNLHSLTICYEDGARVLLSCKLPGFYAMRWLGSTVSPEESMLAYVLSCSVSVHQAISLQSYIVDPSAFTSWLFHTKIGGF